MTHTFEALPHTLDEWLRLIEQRSPQRLIDLGLERVRAVAARMGLRVAAPVFTVAGTNGKGSVCALLEAMLRAAGWRTGVYTSPHLLRFEERCRIDGANAAPQVLAAAFARVEAARGEVPLTYFEFTTLGALDAMLRAGVEALILEVGLGGRLDAVNIVDADCAILTSVGVDHTQLLGATREAIGREKAGIMRAGRPAIICDAQPPASVLAHAAAIGADAWLAGRDFTAQTDGAQWASPCCPGGCRCCRHQAKRPKWCWMWRTTRRRRRCWRRRCTRLERRRARTPCLAPWQIKTWRACSRAWMMWWTPGISATCPRRALPAPGRCWRFGAAQQNAYPKWLPPPSPALRRRWMRRRAHVAAQIESHSLARFSPSLAC